MVESSSALQRTMNVRWLKMAEGEYQGQCNYAYHVDAGALAELLKQHCKTKLGVTQIIDTVEGAELAEDGSIAISADSADSIATISIADTGCGMTLEFIRDRLFRPFDSTKGSQSMGIGVHQARDYVRTLGGQMEVTSEVGVGTTFSVRLPVNE